MLIDFDECEYSWYLYDIAVCLYYQLIGGEPLRLGEKTEYAKQLFGWLMRGYIRMCSDDTYLLSRLDLFFQLRDFVLLSTILECEATNGWQDELVRGACERILGKRPFVEVDFVLEYSKMGLSPGKAKRRPRHPGGTRR